MSQLGLIQDVSAREVIDSRGNPTVEVEIHCEGAIGTAIVPSGKSTGAFEARELRDGGDRLEGMGVRVAVQNVRTSLKNAVIGMSVFDQRAIDQKLLALDGTEQKSNLGANALLGVSLAVAHAAAKVKMIPLALHINSLNPGPMTMPMPMVNMISGGLHAGGNLDFQDFLILPIGAKSYPEALEWSIRIYRKLGIVLEEKGANGTLVGDEGGYGPRLENNSLAAELIVEAIARSGLEPGRDVSLGLDVASSHFYSEGSYQLRATGENTFSSSDLIDLYEGWLDYYPIISIEDGLADSDWEGWKLLTSRLGQRVQLIGDDLFVTNPKRIARGVREGIANAVLIKLNQIGTLSETLDALELAKNSGYWPVISARSGETEDSTISDLAVATGAGQIKIGSIVRSERLAKYNQLLRLGDWLGDQAPYLGGTIFSERLIK